MQRGAAADQIDDAHQRTSRRSAFYVNDFVVVAGAEIDRFADGFVQRLHEGQRDFADTDPRFDDVAEFEQADAEAIGAGVLALDEARRGHRRENPVGGRRVQSGDAGQVLEAGGVRRFGKGIEERHHALDDLDRARRFGGPAGSFGQLDSFIGVV